MTQTNEPTGRAVTWWYCECGEPLNGRLAQDHECEGTDRETEQQIREARHRGRFKQTESADE